jgi:hypothetical protein
VLGLGFTQTLNSLKLTSNYLVFSLFSRIQPLCDLAVLRGHNYFHACRPACVSRDSVWSLNCVLVLSHWSVYITIQCTNNSNYFIPNRILEVLRLSGLSLIRFEGFIWIMCARAYFMFCHVNVQVWLMWYNFMMKFHLSHELHTWRKWFSLVLRHLRHHLVRAMYQAHTPHTPLPSFHKLTINAKIERAWAGLCIRRKHREIDTQVVY